MYRTIDILATGGTIGFKGHEPLDAVTYGERGAPILIDESLARIPELTGITQVRSEQLFIEGNGHRRLVRPQHASLRLHVQFQG